MNQPSRFRIPNRWIFLLLTLAFFQLGVSTESNKIEGLVVDAETTTPLPDVNILAVSVRDTSGTTTDNGGRFILKFSGTRPSELIFSHIGYETLVYPIGSNPDIEIFLVRKSVQIPVISVVGAGSRSNLQVTSSVFKLDEATIEERGFRNLEQSLLSESSITIQRNTDGRETVSIRGSNSCEVGVFVDGVLMNAPFDGVADLSSVNIYDMTDLEVVKGGGSNLFGMGFFGGVINMKSKTPDRNGFGARYAGSTVFSSDRDQYQYINILIDDFSFSFRNLLRSQPLTPENLYSNQYQTAGMTARVPTGKIHFKWFGQVYQIESQNFNPFLMDSTSYFSAQYLGTIPYIGQDWQAQWTTRKDQNSDSFWETAGMNQHTSDVTQIITLMKGFDHSGFSTVFLAEQNSQYFKGSSEFHIDDIYDRQTIMDIDQLNSAGAITTKFITGDLASLVNQITMEAGLRFERSDIDLFKTDNHQISSGYSPSRIDTLQKSITRTLSSRKIGMNLEGR
ncbi:MAG: TonB-dependent receptor plug domain-containing protein, partial [Fidelibacterota bacterium]